MPDKASAVETRPRTKIAPAGEPSVLVSFPSRLGWIAVVGRATRLNYLTFGHNSSEAATHAVPSGLAQTARLGHWNGPLVERLQAYASGARDDFLDVEVDLGSRTWFQRRVLGLCRKIPFGQTLTYGELAVRADRPGAARAVGQCMAANPIPLVIPCHRVVAANGLLGGYSAPGGVDVKRHLLALEAGDLLD
jgi:methylated-DNA-[protein]-cysteine S-methyltransferase